MSRELIKKVIDDRVYKIHLLGSKRGFKIALELAKIFKDPLIIYFTGLQNSKDVDEEEKDIFDNPEMLSGLADKILKNIDPDIMFTYLEEMLANALCDNQPIENIDEHFSGKYFHLFKVFKFLIEANFAGFFTEDLGQTQVETPTRFPE